MKEALTMIFDKMTSQNSTSSECEHCGEPIKFIEINHPFKDETRKVPCACPCVFERRAEEERKQKAREKQIKIKQILRLSSEFENIRNMTFENLSIRKGYDKAYAEVRHAITHFKERGKLGLLLFGETGNGKSHLTAAGGNELLKQGYSVIFITEKDLLDRLNATKNFNNKETFSEIMSACLEADLLIWDDFMSTQHLTNEHKDWIFQIFNGRERGNKPIWATSNLTPSEINSDEIVYKLDDKGRTWWRIVGNMNLVFNKATNFRMVSTMAKMNNVSVEEYESGFN